MNIRNCSATFSLLFTFPQQLDDDRNFSSPELLWPRTLLIKHFHSHIFLNQVTIISLILLPDKTNIKFKKQNNEIQFEICYSPRLFLSLDLKWIILLKFGHLIQYYFNFTKYLSTFTDRFYVTIHHAALAQWLLNNLGFANNLTCH